LVEAAACFSVLDYILSSGLLGLLSWPSHQKASGMFWELLCSGESLSEVQYEHINCGNFNNESAINCMIIVRVSPYSLTWDDAEEQCKTEGAHLAYIPSQAVGIFSYFLLNRFVKLLWFFVDGKILVMSPIALTLGFFFSKRSN
jgi:hypothetical protein